MACCFESCKEREATRRSREIDRYLREESQRMSRQVSVLLAGTHSSGKSTFLKRLRMLYGRGYTEEDRLQLRPDIYRTILSGMASVIRHHQTLKSSLRGPQNEENCQLILDSERDCHCLSDDQFSSYVEPLRSLWSEESIRAEVERVSADEYHLEDSFNYFMSNLDIIGQPGYLPSDPDILRVHTPTIGVNEHIFEVKGALYRFVDFGGCRSSQRKWVRAFEDFTAIFYFGVPSQFDRPLPYDSSTNQLAESVELFKMLSENRCFKSVPFILILNKTDLLAEKVEKKNLKDYFPNFEGNPRDLQEVQKFIFQLYDEVRPEQSKPLKHYFLTTTDMHEIRTVTSLLHEVVEARLSKLQLQWNLR